MRALTAGYFGLGVVGLAIAFLFRDHAQLVNSAVWIRNGAMIASAGLLYLFVERAARGQRRAFLRVRIVSILVPLIIVALVVLPDPFPVWMKVQQALCALDVGGIAILANRPSVRLRFARLNGVAR
ncbi:MAG: hypothetical protein ACREQM_02905 [Candidatus Dormibacteraceae bacterium]